MRTRKRLVALERRVTEISEQQIRIMALVTRQSVDAYHRAKDIETLERVVIGLQKERP